MDLRLINNVFFIGVGGIGMSALARYFNLIGKNVVGYDRTKSELTNELEKEGIVLINSYESDQIPQSCRNPKDTMVVYTPAVPSDIPLMTWFKTHNFPIYKRAQVLGLLTITRKGICVAGTHGKTTVSTMISHLLKNSWLGCSAFLGGISINYNTNLLVSSESNYVVIEADEYDRSFHSLNPSLAVITSIDPDHLDIYGTFENVQQSFNHFASLVKKEGILIVKKGVPINPELKKNVTFYSYALEDVSDFYAKRIRIEHGNYMFDLVTPDRVVKNLILGVPGKVNLENAIAALSVAYLLGCADADLSNGIMSFRGIKRRFEYHVKNETNIYIDDYAHHPNEINATLKSVRELYPTKQLTGVFQPHLFSRTQDFAMEFAESLNLLDELILLDIYPAREEPIEGVTANLIFNNVGLKNKVLISIDKLEDELKLRKPELLITMGAGSIGDMTMQIKKVINELNA